MKNCNNWEPVWGRKPDERKTDFLTGETTKVYKDLHGNRHEQSFHWHGDHKQTIYKNWWE
jgi:hypothetical protein